MKFKRVEIQAFKAYNDVKDGTFDFTTSSHEIADFISIYAPNGFGKSSFYDAVEWGLTNRISRLDGNNLTLTNKEAMQENKDGFVKLYVTSSKAPISNKITKQPVDEKTAGQEHFREVIVSQERIDAFLKEEDAGIRYNKFMRSFGDLHLNNNYNIITELIKLNDRKIEILTHELKRWQGIRALLKTEELMQVFEEIAAEKDFLENRVAPRLEQERQALSEFLGKQVESFFNVKLIHALFRKIDPNPASKAVSFKCDFNAGRPLLNMFVTGEADPVVPTLHFSAAQLNILSLCIFLSKALSRKDDKGMPVDCIFIDDPIQYLDSINILSTIDLLRSIVVNQGKQIILSTRDENLHQLLQKKIPPGKFKAKYLELETPGIVKQ